MQYRRLGRSALKVSELALGTMNFGPRTPEADAFLMLNHALASGLNFVDTADQYGGHLGVGATELLLGRWLAEDRSRREALVLATKVYEPMSDDVNHRGLSARHIVSACEASLKRLGVETIDLYQMHHIDRSAPLDEIWQAMDRLITQGKIIYVGSSNFPGWGIAQTNERRGFQQQLEAMRALHAGQLEAFEAFCAALGMGPSIVALAWLLQQPAVASVMIGPSSVTQLEQALTAGSLKLDVAQLARLDEIFPPMGPAPEAYAW